MNGDTAFGLAEIELYRGVLSECISPERSASSSYARQPLSVNPQGGTELAGKGEVEESNEDNNVGWITALVKASDTTDWGFARMVALYIIREVAIPWVLHHLQDFIASHIGTAAGAALSISFGVGGAILALVLTAPGIGATWVDSIPYDPAGIFTNIIEDKDTIAEIERGTEVGEYCEKRGYELLLNDPGQIIYTIMCADKIYRSPGGHYFYYMKNNLEEQWVVEVEDMQYGLGRVVTAHRVVCCYECNMSCLITEKWVYCNHFTLLWQRPNTSAVWI